MKSEPAGEQRLCLCDPPFEGRAILPLRFGGRYLYAEIAQCTHFIPTDLIQRAQCPHFVPINLLTLGCLGQAVLIVGQHLAEGIKARRCLCPPSKGWDSLAAGLCSCTS